MEMTLTESLPIVDLLQSEHGYWKGRKVPSKVEFLRAKVEAVENALEKTAPKQRENRVSIHLAKDFNAVVKEIQDAFPDGAPYLPKPILWTTTHARMQFSDVSYVDLMIMAEQVRILSVIESHG